MLARNLSRVWAPGRGFVAPLILAMTRKDDVGIDSAGRCVDDRRRLSMRDDYELVCSFCLFSAVVLFRDATLPRIFHRSPRKIPRSPLSVSNFPSGDCQTI